MAISNKQEVINEVIRINKELQKVGYYNENMSSAELNLIRRDIINLINETTQFYSNSGRLDLWEKANLLDAINSISRNLKLQKSTSGLWLCIVEIEESTVEKNERDDSGINANINDFTEKDILALIDKLNI
ncbi:MAG: hypothetical protein BGO43_13010 [Gammaproteobacteria bacterium 39-13]|nr:hypothetical protein [Gammaproteobacteria bacterium]OJV93720.1 MAG: hypothetical protein BGO43_13010 [Gammaproteobacteria bacterium 39-13]